MSTFNQQNELTSGTKISLLIAAHVSKRCSDHTLTGDFSTPAMRFREAIGYADQKNFHKVRLIVRRRMI